MKDSGTQKQRLGTESLKRFEDCPLCLQVVSEPLCCPQGHFYCKECIFEYALKKKKEFRQKWEEYELYAKEIGNQTKMKEAEEQKKVLDNFQKLTSSMKTPAQEQKQV